VSVTDQAEMVTRLAAAGNRVVFDVDRKGRVVRLGMNDTMNADAEQP